MNNKRNCGIDILRVLTMFFIVSGHVLIHGGALETVTIVNKSQFAVIWLIESLIYCGVNCFGLISGYAGYREDNFELKLSKIIQIWMQVVFWGVVILLLEYLFFPDKFSLFKFVKKTMPVTFGEHWYFSAYFCLFFFKPLLNKIVYHAQKETFYLLACILILFSFYSTIAARFSDPLNLNWGRSFLWLVCLYLLGAWMNKYKFAGKFSNKVLLIILTLTLFITWMTKMLFSFLLSPMFGNIFCSIGNFFIINLSPMILIIAVCFLLLFVEIKNSKCGRVIVNYFSPVAFGVYIIHENEFINKIFIADKFVFLIELSFWKIPIVVFGSALVIYIVCAIMEWIRIMIFSLCKVDKFAAFIEKKILLIGNQLMLRILKDV